MLPIPSYINHFIKIWENSSDSFPVFEISYLEKEQLFREGQFNMFQQKMSALKSTKNVEQLKRVNPGNVFFPTFKAFLKSVFDFRQEQLEIILSEAFKEVSKDFFYKARSFDPQLSPENIYQAMRNVWIMNGIQQMMNVQMEITPSVFGYSMIYPYSDNLLDSPEISSEEKQLFSERFNRRLHGLCEPPLDFAEERLFKLVEMFEQQFPRSLFPNVYDSLYAIQQAQTDSLTLMQGSYISTERVRHIAFEKGGTSVLADGYLVAGNLTPKQEQALFGYGVYLQLLDDIQDIKEDADAATQTLFSFVENKELDKLVNRTVHFGRTVLQEMQCFEGRDVAKFLKLMNRSIEVMLIEAVGMSPEYYSENYLNRLEKHSPLHFSFVREKRSQSQSQRFALFKKIVEQTAGKSRDAIII